MVMRWSCWTDVHLIRSRLIPGWGYNAERMLIWGQITPKLPPDLTVRCHHLCMYHTHCRVGKGDHPARRRVASGKWAASRLFPSEAPICTSTLGSRLSQHKNTIQICTYTVIDVAKKYSLAIQCTLFVHQCTLHCGTMCSLHCSDVAKLQYDTAQCNLSSVQFFDAILNCNFQCNAVVHSAVDMARVYYLLNKVEWIGLAQAHALKARLDKTD